MTRRQTASHVTTSPRPTDVRDIAGDSRSPQNPEGEGTFLSCGNARAFENGVLQEMYVRRSRLTQSMRYILELYAIAKRPDEYPAYRGYPKPTRPLWGVALDTWVAKAAGWSKEEVRKVVTQAEQVLRNPF